MAETYTCGVCGVTFDDAESLKDHMITDHATKTETVEEGEAKT
jgi:rubredoxin